MESYWTLQDAEDAEKAKTFKELSEIALRILERMCRGTTRSIIQVCGPITTGGSYNLRGNVEKLERTIQRLRKEGRCVFNQLIFTEHMLRIVGTMDGSWEDKNTRILEDFYLPIFESELIDILYFMPSWRSSQGATWEHDKALLLNIKIVYLSEISVSQ